MKFLKIAEKWFFGTESNSSFAEDLKEIIKFAFLIGLYLAILVIGLSIGG